jgi:hypothetical protein
MSTAGNPPDPAVLVVRLGAMGDIIHTLPAVRALKLGYPHAPLTWVVESKWVPLLEQNPFVDRIVTLDRGSFQGLAASHRAIRQSAYRFAVDFQGLLKSALVAVDAQPEAIYGFDSSLVRERAAAIFYQRRILHFRGPRGGPQSRSGRCRGSGLRRCARFSAAARPSRRRFAYRKVRTGIPTCGMGIETMADGALSCAG